MLFLSPARDGGGAEAALAHCAKLGTSGDAFASTPLAGPAAQTSTLACASASKRQPAIRVRSSRRTAPMAHCDTEDPTTFAARRRDGNG
jgi:hypothetical protein